MTGCLRMVRFLIPGLLLVQALTAAKSAVAAPAPVVARLDVLSTPTLGGSGQLIWAAIPNVTPECAVLTFTVEQPGAPAGIQHSQPIGLAKGQLAEATLRLDTPQPGKYKVSARLDLTVNDQPCASEAKLILNVGQASKTKLLAPATPMITPIAVNAAAMAGALAPGEVKWYSFDVTTAGGFSVETVATQSSSVYTRLFGPDNQSTLLAEGASVAGAGNARLVKWLSPGSYYLKVQALSANAPASYMLRVQSGSFTVPELTSLKINGGAAQTFSRTVTVSTVATGKPIYCKLSESPGFTTAGWQPYAPSLPFTLSAGNQRKQLYMKLLNADGGISAVQSAAIDLYEPINLPADGRVLGYTSEQMGESDWFTFTVTASGKYVLHVDSLDHMPVVALYGPNSSTTLIASDAQEITRGLVPGVYYIQSVGAYYQGSQRYRISLTRRPEPILTGFEIGSSARFYEDTTVVRNVSLSNQACGSAAFYQASESPAFSGARWLPYSTYPSFTLSPGLGHRTVYFRVKDAAGRLSNVTSDTIWLEDRAPLQLGVARPGHIGAYWEYNTAQRENIFTFTVQTAGDYLVAMDGNYFGNFSVDITKAFGDLSWVAGSGMGDENTQQLGAALQPGKYYLHVYGQQFFESPEWASGDYSITVSKYAGNPLVFQCEFVDANGQAYYHESYEDPYIQDRTLRIRNTSLGRPAQFMASESQTFAGAAWQPYAQTAVYKLTTPGNGRKTVYFKVRNAAGRESNVVARTLKLNETLPLTVDGPMITVYRDLDTIWWENRFSFTVTRVGYYTVDFAPGATDPAKHLFLWNPDRLSPAPLASWEQVHYPGFPCTTYKLMPGTYTISVPAVHFWSDDMGNEHNEDPDGVGHYTIRVLSERPLAENFRLNGGATVTPQRSVTLDFTTMCAPRQYLAAERSDFAGASWQAIVRRPAFVLSAGSGPKTVYLKVRTASGLESPVVSASITLK